MSLSNYIKKIIKPLPDVIFTLLMSAFIIFLLLYLFNANLTWVKIFSPISRLLRAELHVVVFAIAAFILISLTFQFKGRKLLPTIIVMPVVLISISSWLNYDFYKDFIVFDSLFLLSELSNGPPLSAFTKMESFPIAMFFLITSLIFLLFIFFLQSWKKFKLHKSTAIILILLCFYHSYGRIIWFFDEAGDLSHISPPHQVQAFTHFIRSAFIDMTGLPIEHKHLHALSELDERVITIADNETFALNKKFTPNIIQSDTKNIILIVLESVRASETGFLGYDYGATPVLDSIAENNLAFTNFYANSNQTVRAETSLLCGVLDYSSGAPFSVRSLPLNINCVPKVLADKGYETLWFHGNDQEFFNRKRFLPQLGFKHIYAKPDIELLRESKELIGWGIPDEDLFKVSTQVLEKTKQPFFAQILTLSNHYPFDYDFPEDIKNFNETPPLFNDYLKAIRYTDYSLGLFWEWFQNSPLKENTAVFIVSDHGLLVMSDKQKQANAYYKHEMQFHIPMVAFIPHLKNNVDLNRVYSQLDLPATIYDLLNIDEENSYLMGAGIFDPEKKNFALSTGFYNYVLRKDNTLCFPNAPDETLISKTNNAYYDGRGIDKVNIACTKTKSDILRSFDTSELTLTPPKNSYKDIIRIIDNFLTFGFRSDPTQ